MSDRIRLDPTLEAELVHDVRARMRAFADLRDSLSAHVSSDDMQRSSRRAVETPRQAFR